MGADTLIGNDVYNTAEESDDDRNRMNATFFAAKRRVKVSNSSGYLSRPVSDVEKPSLGPGPGGVPAGPLIALHQSG
jgi:hypothetical protein